MRTDADWRGRWQRRFNWRRFRFEWGRMCYRTNCTGGTLESWFEPEQPATKAPK